MDVRCSSVLLLGGALCSVRRGLRCRAGGVGTGRTDAEGAPQHATLRCISLMGVLALQVEGYESVESLYKVSHSTMCRKSGLLRDPAQLACCCHASLA